MANPRCLAPADLNSVLSDLCECYTAAERRREDIKELVVQLQELKRRFGVVQNLNSNILNPQVQSTLEDCIRTIIELQGIRDKIWSQGSVLSINQELDVYGREVDYAFHKSTVTRVAILVQSCLTAISIYNMTLDLLGLPNTVESIAPRGQSEDQQHLKDTTQAGSVIGDHSSSHCHELDVQSSSGGLQQTQELPPVRTPGTTDTRIETPQLPSNTSITFSYILGREAVSRHGQYNSDEMMFDDHVETWIPQIPVDFRADKDVEPKDTDLSLADTVANLNSFDPRSSSTGNQSRIMQRSGDNRKHSEALGDGEDLRYQPSEHGLLSNVVPSFISVPLRVMGNGGPSELHNQLTTCSYATSDPEFADSASSSADNPTTRPSSIAVRRNNNISVAAKDYYRVHPATFFTVGRVFFTLLPASEKDDISSIAGLREDNIDSPSSLKIHRFVVIQEGEDECTALPISIYRHQGVAELGVNESQHGIIYTPSDSLSNDVPTELQETICPTAIRVDADEPSQKLDRTSRIHYGSPYILSHATRIKSFGIVSGNSMAALVHQFTRVWRESFCELNVDFSSAARTVQDEHGFGLRDDRRYMEASYESQESFGECIPGRSLLASLNELDSLVCSEKATYDNAMQGVCQPSSVVESSISGIKPKSIDILSSNGPATHLTSMTSISEQRDESKEPVGNTADGLTIRSQIDGESLNLEEGDESQLIAIFVEELFQAMHSKLGYMPEPENVAGPVAELLKSYAILMGQAVIGQDQFHKGAIDFVRSRRMKIANKFVNFKEAGTTAFADTIGEPDTSDVLPYGHKVTSWLHEVVEDPLQEVLQDVILEHPSSSQISELAQRTMQMRCFLTESDAWNWLVHRLVRACVNSCGSGSRTLSNRVQEEFERAGATVRSGLIQVRYLIDWQPQRFLADNFTVDQQPTLRNVITTTCCEDKLLAIPCGDYVESTWPTFGPEMLDAIVCVLQSGNARTSTNLTVDAASYIAILADIGEFLGWLGSTCRVSPFDNRHCFCTVHCTVSKDEKSIQDGGRFLCELNFELSELETKLDSSSTCWRQLFRNISIANGFPVPRRWNNEPGLEISGKLMVLLGDTPWADIHNGNFMLKGFSSMFIPIELREGSIFWHFRRLDEFIPYSMADSSCIKKAHITPMDLAWLFQQRHFVGWTIRADKHLGTEANDYSAIEDPNTDFMRSGMVLKEATISTGKFLNLEITAARGNHQAPLVANRSDDYLEHLNHIESTNVVLYDTGHKRAWLVDGASALLHITCGQLRSAEFVKKHNLLSTNLAQYAGGDRSPADVLRDWETRRLIIRHEGRQVQEAEKGAETAKDQTTIWRFGDLVASNCNYLLKMHEHQVRPPSGLDVRFTDRHRLEGWSFNDVVEHMAFMQPRMVYLRPSGRGWTHYVRTIQAVTLMGEGFGELITPATATCQRWETVPKGKDYLATTVDRLVWNSKKHGNRKDFPSFLAKGVRWHQAHQLFDSCSCATRKCNPVQVILPQLSFAIRQPKIPDERFAHGAVIFGQNERFRFWYPPNPRQDPEVDLDGAKESRDPTICTELRSSLELEPLEPYQREELGSLSGSDSADRNLMSPVLTNATGSTTPATSVQSRPDIVNLLVGDDMHQTNPTPSNNAVESNSLQLLRGTLTCDMGSSSSKQAIAQSSIVHETRPVAKASWRNWKFLFIRRNRKK